MISRQDFPAQDGGQYPGIVESVHAPDRGAPPSASPAVNWDRPSRPLVEAAATVANILLLADRCVDIRDQLDCFAELHGRGPALPAKPAFAELVADMSAAFHLLTAAIDHLEITGRPWRHLIADARILAGLEAGIAREKEILRACALRRFLENESFAAAVVSLGPTTLGPHERTEA